MQEIVEDLGHERAEGRSEAAPQLVGHAFHHTLEDILLINMSIKCYHVVGS